MKIKHKYTKQARIEILPLIDIVFLLLVFFIYAMLSMAVHHGLQLDLPTSSEAAKTEESPISLSLKNGEAGIELYLNKEIVSPDELHQRLMVLGRDKQKQQILVFAEKNVSYQQLFKALDELKACGLSEISLQATPE